MEGSEDRELVNWGKIQNRPRIGNNEFPVRQVSILRQYPVKSFKISYGYCHPG